MVRKLVTDSDRKIYCYTIYFHVYLVFPLCSICLKMEGAMADMVAAMNKLNSSGIHMSSSYFFNCTRLLLILLEHSTRDARPTIWTIKYQ
jgi:hypothetical protein